MILHADVDAFYASVAQRDEPRLRGQPVIVGSWVVMAASYEARAFGIRGGMATARARALCPGAEVVDPCWQAYVDAGRAVFAIFERFAPRVEAGSMEEAFLDVPDAAPGAAGALAARLRRAVREQTGLPLSVGVARTKVLAKMASGAAKPDGLLVVAPERELEFLRPLAVERVWGVGPATARKLRAHGLRTVGEAAALGEGELMRILGKAAGRYVYAIAHNRDRRPVARRRGRRSFGAQRALGRRARSPGELRSAVGELAERLARRMAGKGRAGRTVVLRLRFGDYTRASRSSTLACPTAEAATIAATARELLGAALPAIERRGITLVGLTVTNLVGVSPQLPLFEDIGAATLPEYSPRVAEFEGVVESARGGGAVVELPAEVVEALGAGKRFHVRGTLNGVEFASSTMPMGGGRVCLGLHKATRERAGVGPGDAVRISVERSEPAEVEVPGDLREALAGDPEAAAAFERLAYSHRREYAQWIAEAKRPETRARRVAETLERLRAAR